MSLIQQLLREKLNEKFLNESFFEKMETPFDDVIECVKNIFFNLRTSIGEKHKLEFFSDRLATALTEYKDSSKKPKKILDKISDLESEFDNSLLKILKIKPLLLKINNGGNKAKLIDSYLEELHDNVKAIFSKYKDKIKADKTYESITAVNDDIDKLTLKKFLKEKYFLQIELLKLQEWASNNDKKILILFEGRDAAGKGSNIETFSEFLNPKNLRVETFGVPTEDEKKDWFKRYTKVLPKAGEIVLFDRSWYNRAVIEPAMDYCTTKQYNDFMDSVGEYEENLINKKDIILIKIWLNVTKTKQKLRFELRKRDPLRYWKYSENDSKMLNKWNKLTPYIDKMLDKTNTVKSPWEIIESDDKLNGILESLRRVLNLISYEGKDVSAIHGKKKGDDIIFLDFHGVLITKWHKLDNGNLDCNKGWDKTAVNNLNKITDKTGAKLVVISYCKNEMTFDELKDNLKRAGVTGDIIGKTINIDRHLRIEQVNDYIKNHKVEKFIVLDDKDYDYADNEEIKSVWIQPKHHIGLTEKELNLALDLLESE